ncbi:DUF2087 domain-containing protein [Promicromonospora sp. Marseille-Q5078]
MLVDEDVRDVLKRSRMAIGVVRAPKLRKELAAALEGDLGSTSESTAPPVEALRWFVDGEVDLVRLAEDYAALGTLLSEAGLLAYGPISEWPAREQDRPEFVRAVVDRVFLGESRGWMTEVELNARLAMVFVDPSGLRRFAVDTGLLAREVDGSRYWLRRPSTTDGDG